MQTANTAAIVKLSHDRGWMKARVFGNPGPFPFGPPSTMGKAQFIGISDHLVMTLMEDRYLVGLLPMAADCPATAGGRNIQWCGGVQAQPWKGDIVYRIHPLFLRDPVQILAEAKNLQLEAWVTGVLGRISNRQYWLVEIPAITAGVMLNIDEITVVQRRKKYKPPRPASSKVTRGEFWQTGCFQAHPAYNAMKGDDDVEDTQDVGGNLESDQMGTQAESGDGSRCE